MRCSGLDRDRTNYERPAVRAVSADRGGALAARLRYLCDLLLNPETPVCKSLISRMALRRALRKSLISTIVSDNSHDVLLMGSAKSAREKLGSSRSGLDFKCLPRLPAQPLRTMQTEELITASRGHGDGNDAAIGREGGWRGRPSARLQIRTLLEHESGGGRIPGNSGLGARALDAQGWRAGCLHGGNDAPKAARQGIIAAAHAGGGWLADGAAQGIGGRAGGAGAGAASAADGVPVDAVTLSLQRARKNTRCANDRDGQ